jgi:hypothetical protein
LNEVLVTSIIEPLDAEELHLVECSRSLRAAFDPLLPVAIGSNWPFSAGHVSTNLAGQKRCI